MFNGGCGGDGGGRLKRRVGRIVRGERAQQVLKEPHRRGLKLGGGIVREERAQEVLKRTKQTRVKTGWAESSKERDRVQQVLKEPHRRGLKMGGANRQRRESS
jgi:hypothetical protein